MRFERVASLAAVVAFAAAAAGPAQGEGFDFAVEAGGAHSDNIDRTADGRAEDIANAAVRFSFDQRSARLRSDVVGNFDYQKYLDDTFDPDLLASFAGNVAYDFIPERFTWSASDNFGSVLADPFLPATPLNREDINFFSTGPDAHIALGSQLRLNLGARYLRTDYEQSPLDSSTTLGEIGFGRELGDERELSLSARRQQVSYAENSLNADYDQTDVFVRYAAKGARTELKVDAGYSEIDRDSAEGSLDTPLIRVTASRRVSPSSSLILRAGREFTNSGSAFADLQSNGRISLDPQAGRQTPAPYKHDFGTLSWAFAARRTNTLVSAQFDRQVFDDQPVLNQKFTTLFAEVRRALSEASTIVLNVSHVRGIFQANQSEYQDSMANASFNWDFTRHLAAAISYQYTDRNGNELIGSYTENRVWLRITYRYGAPRVEMLRPEYGGEPLRD